MSSREKILAAVLANQPARSLLTIIDNFPQEPPDNIETFKIISGTIGGTCYDVSDMEELQTHFHNTFSLHKRIISNVPGVHASDENWQNDDPHQLEDVDVAVISGHFGVAENSAVWITEELVGHRVLPFICQHLVVIIKKTDIVSTMHQAYHRIADAEYPFGVFIAGPSKTADIEQSLVLGAHGPRSLTVYLVD
jgi:L-lactate dehydrogenase complex protein LldG